MRRTGSITSVSWIPSEAITGPMRLGFTAGPGHYDDPPDAALDVPIEAGLAAWRDADRFRFANHLAAWVDADDDGRITGCGYVGGGLLGATTLQIGRSALTFAAIAYPELRAEPEVGEDGDGGWVRFRQTVGGRTGVPMPRTVRRPPYVQLAAPTVWTTLELTISTDGRSAGGLTGASPFPRHWVYDGAGRLTAKNGLTDYAAWSRDCFGDHSPWGNRDSHALVTAAETALERTLSTAIMRSGAQPRIRTVAAGEVVVAQGQPGTQVFLLLDGVLSVVVDGEVVAEVGPGAVAGERALLEGGLRTSTLRARTPVRLAVADAGQLDVDALRELARGHQREDVAATRPTA